MLSLSGHLPEVTIQPGDVLVAEGAPSEGLWVLVHGALEVRKGEVVVNTITLPGALVGEMSELLHRPSSATVVASGPSTLRHAADGQAFLESDPAVLRLVAQGMAERLAFVTTYLADLKHQYGDAPGLAMVGQVLSELAQRQAPAARPGSVRDPDPEY
jgi:CRP/FNR family transcriptional regulator, cyclic AMP receptor protein